MTLTNDNYFSVEASMEYFGVSSLKSFDACEARALAECKGEYKRPDTTALLVGSYADAYFEGTLENFKTEHPEIFKKDGTLKNRSLKQVKLTGSRSKSKWTFTGQTKE